MNDYRTSTDVSSFWNGLSTAARDASTYVLVGSALSFFLASTFNLPGPVIDGSAGLAFSSAINLGLALGLERLNPLPKKFSPHDFDRGRRTGMIASVVFSLCIAAGLNMIQNTPPEQAPCNAINAGVGVIYGGNNMQESFYCPSPIRVR